MNSVNMIENAAFFRANLEQGSRRRQELPRDLQEEMQIESSLVVCFTDSTLNLLVASVDDQSRPIMVQRNISMDLPGGRLDKLSTDGLRSVMTEAIRVMLVDESDVSALMQRWIGVEMPAISKVLVVLPPEWTRKQGVVRQVSLDDGASSRRLDRATVMRNCTLMNNESLMMGYTLLDGYVTHYLLDQIDYGMQMPIGTSYNELEIRGQLLFGEDRFMAEVESALKEHFSVAAKELRWTSSACGFMGANEAEATQVVMDISEHSLVLNYYRERGSVRTDIYGFGSRDFRRCTSNLFGDDDEPDAVSDLFCREYIDDVLTAVIREQDLLGMSDASLLVIGDNERMLEAVLRAAKRIGIAAHIYRPNIKGDVSGICYRTIAALQESAVFAPFERFPRMSYRKFRAEIAVKRTATGLLNTSKRMLALAGAAALWGLHRRNM